MSQENTQQITTTYYGNKKVHAPDTQPKLTLLMPEEGCGGDDPYEGYLMKGLGTPDKYFYENVINENYVYDPVIQDAFNRWFQNIQD